MDTTCIKLFGVKDQKKKSFPTPEVHVHKEQKSPRNSAWRVATLGRKIFLLWEMKEDLLQASLSQF